MLQQILFILIFGGAFFIASGRYRAIYRNIRMGKPAALEGDTSARWRNVLLVAFGQKKMFKQWIPATFHFFIYAAFLLTQVELIEIILDGISGQHRLFAPVLGGFYTFTINFIEILSVLALVATIVFLWRRNIKKVPRLKSAEMKGWPSLDANIILIGELLLLTGIFSMNGADGLLQSIDPQHYPDTGTLLVSTWIGQSFFAGLSPAQLIGLERFGWWLHLIVVLGFLVYLPFSKHLHIFLAFFNTYMADLGARGRMENMPEIAKEVRVMMGLEEDKGATSEELPEFGANDVFGLNQTVLLGAYTCTECGRCTSQCPANITGKKLSPRKIMMDIRDRMEEVRRNVDIGNPELIKEEYRVEGARLTSENYDDGKSLFDYISREEIHACTTCNACVEACPVLINPLEPILALRRYEILTESAGPPDWLPMFNSLESSQSPWQIPDPRNKWAETARTKSQ
jgi:heterodisulfide reductase subunit C